MRVGDLMGPGDDEALTPAQVVERQRNLKKARTKILTAVRLKLIEDVDAYLEGNEEKIFFTVANGGGFVIGIDVFLPDSRTVSEAMADSAAPLEQLELVSAEEEDAETAAKREAVMEAVQRELENEGPTGG